MSSCREESDKIINDILRDLGIEELYQDENEYEKANKKYRLVSIGALWLKENPQGSYVFTGEINNKRVIALYTKKPHPQPQIKIFVRKKRDDVL